MGSIVQFPERKSANKTLRQMPGWLHEEVQHFLAALRTPKHPDGWKERLVIRPVRTVDGKLRFFTDLLRRKVDGKWEYKDLSAISADEAADRVW